jgi:formate dehydrogenase subunit gamma
MINFYTNYSGVLIGISILLPIVAALFHYIIIGAKGVSLNLGKNVIPRFSMTERVFHFIRTLFFIIVAGTGIFFIFYGGSISSGITHGISGNIFLIISICTLAIWFKTGLFEKYDWLWLRRLGGYLAKEEVHFPAGKFNAGQKVFFWLSMLLTLIVSGTGISLQRSMIAQAAANDTILVIHGISAALLILMVIGHIYLSLWVNKGTWRVLIGGKVSQEWAACHHPLWESALQTNEEENKQC